MSSLAPKQAAFAADLAHYTGLNPQVIGAWLLAEQSGSAARFYESRGNNNWLNVGNVDSNPTAGNRFRVWGDPHTAAKATAEWLAGRGSLAHEYGSPAAGIQRILGTAGHGPQAQIHAIADSGWASSGYNGGHTLEQLMSQVGHIPSGAMGMAPSLVSHFYHPETGTRPGEAQQAQADYEKSLQAARGSNAVAGLFTGSKPGDALLRSMLHREAPTPPGAEHSLGPSAVTKHVPGANTQHLSTGLSGGYGGFVQEGSQVGVRRRDQGRDLQLKPGASLLASGDGIVVGVKSDPNGFGPAYPVVHFTTGPDAGKTIYFGHTDAAVRQGQTVRRGQAVAHTSHTGHNAPPGWVEIGLAPGGVPGPFGQPLPKGL